MKNEDFSIVELMWLRRERRRKGVRSIEGVPPLTFKSNGANLNNYRIYGNTVNGESVGNLVENGEHTGEYRVPVTINSNATSIYLPYQIRKVGDEAEYIDYGEQKQRRVRKNLLQNTATSQTIDGVTFMVNSDGSVTCNGAPSTSTPSTFFIPLLLSDDLYIVSGCPENGGSSNYRVDIRNENWSVRTYNNASVADIGSGCLFDTGAYLCIRIASGYTCDNLTFYPMIRKADIEDDTYEPYIANTDADVTLPALPTLSGTNTLTVGTEVQPLNVEIKGSIKEVS